MNEDKRNVVILYCDARREYYPTEEQYKSETDGDKEAEKITPYLEEMGYTVRSMPGGDGFIDKIQPLNPLFVINLVESFHGKPALASYVPAALEILGIPYLGPGVKGLVLDGDKFLGRKTLEQAGISVPNHQLFQSPDDRLNPGLKFPLITKINEAHGSVEINQNAISEDENHLRTRVKNLIDTYHCPVLAEEFVAGRELTAIYLAGGGKKVYFGEKCFESNDDKYKIASFGGVWGEDSSYTYRSFDDPELEEEVAAAFEALKMRDYGKFDIRLDDSGKYFLIDCNANMAFGPGEDYAISNVLRLYDVDFKEILSRLVNSILTRS